MYMQRRYKLGSIQPVFTIIYLIEQLVLNHVAIKFTYTN